MKFEIINQNPQRNIEIGKRIEKDGVLYLHIKMTQSAATVPEAFSLKWKSPVKDCFSVWAPDYKIRQLGPNWAKRTTPSRLAEWMPLHTLVSATGKNRMAIAVSDAVTPISIATGVCEEDACFDCVVNFFTSAVSARKEYEAVVRIDTRDIPYYDSIYDVVSWWENDCGYKPTPVPDHARLPMNSLWYSYHQELDVEDIIEECRLSKKTGMDTVIVDDGWQTDDNNRGYAFCGDWEVAKSKIPDMKEFVQRVHDTGMKFMLWYSVPFMGINSKNYARFRHMLLDESGNNKTYWALDPRYKEVREFLIDTYKSALLNWGIDGLKLDFIDSFVLKGKSLKYDERRDYQSLEDAINVLMIDIASALKEINNDVLIEFRQTYVGPAIRQYGNMLRVGDCPNDAIVNRSNIVDLRLTSGETAVHSDMIMWNYDDSVESAAIQIASVLYSVPQISMKLKKLNDEHQKMLGFYLDFWRKHRDTLINGRIIAENPETNYSIVCAKGKGQSIYTAYTDCLIDGTNEKEVIAVNATRHSELIFKNLKDRNYRIVNCMGEEVAKGTLAGELSALKVPLCGIVFVE